MSDADKVFCPTTFSQDMDGSMEPSDDGEWVRFEDFDEAIKALEAERDALRRAINLVDGDLSRVLHECAGAVSLCWEPRPTGAFQSTQACKFVAEYIAELRAPLRAAAGDPHAQLPEV